MFVDQPPSEMDGEFRRPSHDFFHCMIFFITLFRYFTIVLFFTLHFFSFSQGMQTRERAHCARSVFPFIKKKKKKKKKASLTSWQMFSAVAGKL